VEQEKMPSTQNWEISWRQIMLFDQQVFEQDMAEMLSAF